MKTINRIEIVTTHRRVVIRCSEDLEDPGTSRLVDTPDHVAKQISVESDSTKHLKVLREAVRILTDCIGPE